MKTIYTLKFQIDDNGTPQVHSSWSNYNDDKIKDIFNEIQIYVIAKEYLRHNYKDEKTLKKIFVNFCKQIAKGNKKEPAIDVSRVTPGVGLLREKAW